MFSISFVEVNNVAATQPNEGSQPIKLMVRSEKLPDGSHHISVPDLPLLHLADSSLDRIMHLVEPLAATMLYDRQHRGQPINPDYQGETYLSRSVTNFEIEVNPRPFQEDDLFDRMQ